MQEPIKEHISTAYIVANNKGEFRSRPISAFVYILALSQSECANRYFVNKDG